MVWRRAGEATIAYAAAYSALVLWNFRHDVSSLEDWAFLPLYLAAGFGALAGSVNGDSRRRDAIGWRCIGYGWFFSFVGAVGFLLPWRPDWMQLTALVSYKAYYPLLIAGFTLLAVVPRERAARLRLALEVAIVVVAGITLGWYFVWNVSLAPTGPNSIPGIDAIVPVGEIAVLIAASIVLHRPTSSDTQRSLELLGAGALTAAVSDLMLVQAFEVGNVALRHIGAIVQAASAVLFACAGFWSGTSSRRASRQLTASLPYGAISIVGALVLFEVVRGHQRYRSLTGLAFGAVALTALVIARLAVAERDARAQTTARREQEERFRALVQRSSEALIVVDDAGVIRYAGGAVLRVFGRSGEALEGAPLDALGVGDAVMVLRGILARPQHGALMQWSARLGDSPRDFETVVDDLRDDRLVRGLMLTTRDVTERVLLERKLQHSQKLDALGLLAGGVAHDFNNLLMAIRANADLALADPALDPSAELEEIRLATQRAATLCRQLLLFGRPEPGASRLVELSALVHDVMPMLRRVVPSTIALQVYEDSARTTTQADRSQVEVALLNVVMNARDAIVASGTIALRLAHCTLNDGDVALPGGAEPGAYVELSVRDDGRGMDAATLARVFEPFFTTKASSGTGLGLSTVYGTMKALRGHVHIVSTPGEGTTVSLRFPHADELQERRVLAPMVERPTTGSGVVLLVDDERAVRQIVERRLQLGGFEVCTASDGIDALEALRRLDWRVDAVVSDMHMPRMNGATLAARIRARVPDMPVVLMSGYASSAELNGVEVASDVVRLVKPFDVSALIALLQTLLEPTDR